MKVFLESVKNGLSEDILKNSLKEEISWILSLQTVSTSDFYSI